MYAVVVHGCIMSSRSPNVLEKGLWTASPMCPWSCSDSKTALADFAQPHTVQIVCPQHITACLLQLVHRAASVQYIHCELLKVNTAASDFGPTFSVAMNATLDTFYCILTIVQCVSKTLRDGSSLQLTNLQDCPERSHHVPHYCSGHCAVRSITVSVSPCTLHLNGS